MTGDRSKLTNFVNKFLGTIKFGNDHVAKILGYGDYHIGNVTISRVYYVEGLGHNLFSVGQFYDSNLKVAFRQHTCFVRNLEARHGLVRGLPKLKFEKYHLCSACAMGKSKKKPHKPKSKDTNQENLYLLHMDLCGPMCVASVNGKKYTLVIVDDYSRFTWVKYLRYGYCKNLKKTVKTGQTWTRERIECTRAGRMLSRITSTLRFRNVPNDVIKLMMFPYSLEGAAKTWYEKEPPNSILTWEDLVTKFVNQFFPPSKTTHLKNEISRFTQKFEETFSEAWERFKELLRACPHHGFTELTQVDTFYNGLNENEQDSLNVAAGGNLLSKTTREAL
ncbi:retrovirus-related pol polyprotein from transposon TNT 1-94 [Tanacetum coccineum]